MAIVNRTDISCGIMQLYELGVLRSGLPATPHNVLNELFLRNRIVPNTTVTEHWKSRTAFRDRDWYNGIRDGAYSSIFKGDIVVFSDADKHGTGLRMAEYIRAANLGSITDTGPIKNESSGNMIRLFTWVYNGNELPPQEAAK